MSEETIQDIAGDQPPRGDSEAERIAALEAQIVERDGAVAERDDEIAALKRQLSAQKGAATRARAEAQAARSAGELRKLGAPKRKPVKDDDAAAAESTGDELRGLVDNAETIEIVASDGTRELADVPGYKVPGDGFAVRRGQLVLTVPTLRITGPNTGGAPRTITGFALVVDGEQVAWGALPDPLPLGASQEYELRDSVVFGNAASA